MPTNKKENDKYIGGKISRRKFLKLSGIGGAIFALSKVPMIEALSHDVSRNYSNFLVYQQGSNYKAKNMVSEEIEYSSIDATAAIQFALDNLSYGRLNKETVKLGGDFVVSKINIPSFTVLDLTEAKITQANSTNDFLFVNSDVTMGNTNIDIFGGYIDGNKSRQSEIGSNDSNSIVHLKKCTDCRIVDGVYVNGNFHQIRIRDSSNIMVNRCTSKNPRHEHISISAQGKTPGTSCCCIVTNCRFSGINDGSAFPGETFVSTVNVEDVIISDNVCDTTANDYFWDNP